jgi:hypothetical protein
VETNIRHVKRKQTSQAINLESKPKKVNTASLLDTDTIHIAPQLDVKAGNLKNHLPFWKGFTSDPNILKMVSGCTIQFDELPYQHDIPLPYKFSETKKSRIDHELQLMYEKHVIERVDDSEWVFISNVFTRDKPDGSLRIILDLTVLNTFVTYHHFKMDNLSSAISLLSPGAFMASIDWKEAYYSVPIDIPMRNFLAFKWDGITYRFTCLPNGLSCAPRVFTKLTKVLFSKLREKGHLSTSYIDDCLLVAKSRDSCVDNVKDTIKMSQNAGFTIHATKSVLTPTQRIVFLGFWLNTVDMTVKLTDEKAKKLKHACENILQKDTISLQNLAEVIGMMVASFPGVQYGQLFYRQCDNLKNKGLTENRGDYSAKTLLTAPVISDLKWWINNIETECKVIKQPSPRIVIETDASNTGWGACVQNDKTKTTGGNWSTKEADEHINYKELLAVWLGLQCFASEFSESHIKILTDNTTTVAYINKQGGTKSKCNTLANLIWTWCYKNNNWISASHIPGTTNVRADKESRSKNDNMEWDLSLHAFEEICCTFGTPEIDLFASRLNNKVDKYFSWKPDPQALAIDAMSENWQDKFFYAFPPFNLVGPVLQKIELENCTGIVVVPKWPTQTWWPKFMQLCSCTHLVLSRKRGQPMLTHPRRHEKELPKMTLVAGLLSKNNI